MAYRGSLETQTGELGVGPRSSQSICQANRKEKETREMAQRVKCMCACKCEDQSSDP